ncbi:hypothetical protein HDU97_005829 [Phlyctochytrium planicorne]|nr:hypothetical protein HDU97_005829 [Phlyctochytrium planicorne]
MSTSKPKLIPRSARAYSDAEAENTWREDREFRQFLKEILATSETLNDLARRAIIQHRLSSQHVLTALRTMRVEGYPANMDTLLNLVKQIESGLPSPPMTGFLQMESMADREACTDDEDQDADLDAKRSIEDGMARNISPESNSQYEPHSPEYQTSDEIQMFAISSVSNSPLQPSNSVNLELPALPKKHTLFLLPPPTLPIPHQDPFLCRICFDKPRNAKVTPCGHDELCGDCAEVIVTCPSGSTKGAVCPFCRGEVWEVRLIS